MPNYRVDANSKPINPNNDNDHVYYAKEYSSPRTGNYRIEPIRPNDSELINQRTNDFDETIEIPIRQERQKIYQYSDYSNNNQQNPRTAQNQISNDQTADTYVRYTSNQYSDYPSPYENEPLRKWYHQLQHQMLVRNEDQLNMLPQGKVKLLAVVILIYLTMFICGWQLMPFNKVNNLTVSGNEISNASLLASATGIRSYDNAKDVIANRQMIEEQIIAYNPLVESVVFRRNDWRQLEIVVNEHNVVATINQENGINFVLDNGSIVDMAIAGDHPIINNLDHLPEIIGFSDSERIVELSRSLRQIQPTILSQINQIYRSEDPNKPNGIEVQMDDGNQVRAIISTFAQKINHYPSMVAQLADMEGVINLEVGAYFIPQADNQSSIKLVDN